MQQANIDEKRSLTHCTTLQLTEIHRNTLQHTAKHCNTLQHLNVDENRLLDLLQDCLLAGRALVHI